MRRLIPLLLWASPALAAPQPAAELVLELVALAREGSVPPAWLREHVDPGPSGWSDAQLAVWQHALGPEAPLTLALARTEGIVHAEARTDRPSRVVLDGRPLLGLRVDTRTEPARIVALERTTCTTCDERTRFVRDLVDDVRRRGQLGARLRPGVDLDVTGWLEENRRLASQHWTSRVDVYLHADATVADLVAGAVVDGREDDVVSLAYPDGRRDTWRLAWDDAYGWRIDYRALAPDSPLRLDEKQASAWRRSSMQQATRLATWRPTWRREPDGVGLHLGHDALGAAFDPRDETVLVAVLDLDRSAAALFRVDPATRSVVERLGLPGFSSRLNLPTGEWFSRWHLALSPGGDRAAVSSPDGVWLVDLVARTTERLGRVARVGDVSALAFDEGDRVALALADGRVLWRDEVHPTGVTGRPLALQVGGGAYSLVTEAGEVVQGRLDGPTWPRATVCGGQASDAAWREADGSWLVACGPDSVDTFALVPWFEGPVVRQPGEGAEAGGAAWSPAGDRLATPGPPGASAIVWDGWRRRAEVVLGREPLQGASFSPDGDQLLGVTRDGEVILWDLARARAAHWLLAPESEEETP